MSDVDMPPAQPPAGLHEARALHIDGAGRHAIADRVVEETPVALLYNGHPFAVMMATPCDLEDFALGFALSEGIVEQPREFQLVDCTRTGHGISLQALIPHARFEALEARKRNLAGRSGCGLCGTESLQDAVRPLSRVDSRMQLEAQAVIDALHALAQRQPLNAQSGGVHAAGYAWNGDILAREDVGRHNALDKLVGALAGNAANGSGATDAWRERRGFLVITSRASYEIVHKAASVGIAVVAAISAPTSLAIRLADDAGVTLIGFARDAGMNVYTHAQRLR
ncbi:MAG TPA: formate dehydrogenase accessory sulfurtransferase FdhD [Rhodanobacteraceae bacterium]|nr:formate dehydrogenase accessory sulfurtransferase FdhD [Rhodanobacteraceae bacterium]